MSFRNTLCISKLSRNRCKSRSVYLCIWSVQFMILVMCRELFATFTGCMCYRGSIFTPVNLRHILHHSFAIHWHRNRYSVFTGELFFIPEKNKNAIYFDAYHSRENFLLILNKDIYLLLYIMLKLYCNNIYYYTQYWNYIIITYIIIRKY